MKIVITPHHAQGFSIGYILGIAVMFGAAVQDLNRAHKDVQRAIDYAKEVKAEAWMYLPGEIKTKMNNRTEFYNIALKEEL